MKGKNVSMGYVPIRGCGFMSGTLDSGFRGCHTTWPLLHSSCGHKDDKVMRTRRHA